MNHTKWLVSVLVVFVVACSHTVSAQSPPAHRHVIVPKSSMSTPADVGVRAHTNLLILSQESGPIANASPSELPPFLGYGYETPASFACVYQLVRNALPGCNPNQTTQNPSGGAGAIAIVDAFDDPNAASDLAAFCSVFGLPPANFTVVYASGSQPGTDPTGGWELEESLDIEYAHAMAPNAKIYLVEANTNSFSDLFTAVVAASNLVASSGGGEVNMSWGGGEFSTETNYDGLFITPKVVYIAAVGDAPGVGYPAASPNVVAAGGTSISRSLNTGNFILESTWQDGGSGSSFYEPRPHFQDRIASIVGSTRGVPDLSFDANPTSGAWVFDSFPYDGVTAPWWIVGGTSLSAPALAGIINRAGGFQYSSQAENEEIYDHIFSGRFRDIVYGNCGYYNGDFAVPGWDFCTGVGSVLGLHGK